MPEEPDAVMQTLKLATGQQEAAVAIPEAFGGKCYSIVRGAQRAADQGNLREGTFDMAALKVHLRSEAPELEED